MKKTVLLILLLLISKLTYSQMGVLNNLEIGKIIFSKTDLRGFINNDDIFISCSYNKLKLLELNHPLNIFNFNKEVKTKTEFRVLGMAVKEIYGYLKDKDHFSLYLIINIDKKEQANRFIEKLGWPWNITKDSFESGDFDMLLWQKNELEVSIMSKFNGGMLLTITNLTLDDLINKSPL